MQVNISSGNILFKNKGVVSATLSSLDKNLNVNNARIVNLKNPVNDNDAVTKVYAEQLINSNIPFRYADYTTNEDLYNLSDNIEFTDDEIIFHSFKNSIKINSIVFTKGHNGLKILVKDQVDNTYYNAIYKINISDKIIIFSRVRDTFFNGLVVYVKYDKSMWEYDMNSGTFSKYSLNFSSQNNSFEKINNISNVPIINLLNQETNNQLTLGGTTPTIQATGNDTSININLIPKGTGNVVISNIKYPTNDGAPGQVLCTDGNKNLYFASLDVPLTTTITTQNNIPVKTLIYNIDDGYIYNLNFIILCKDNTSGAIINHNVFVKSFGRIIRLVGKTENKIIDNKLINIGFHVDVIGTNLYFIVTGLLNVVLNWKISYKIDKF